MLLPFNNSCLFQIAKIIYQYSLLVGRVCLMIPLGYYGRGYFLIYGRGVGDFVLVV